MIVQVILTALFVVLASGGVLVARRDRGVGLGLASASAAALLLVWRPDWATELANAFGVGRGADLLLYLWFTISALLFLAMHLRVMRLDDRLGELVMQLAARDFTEQAAPEDGA